MFYLRYRSLSRDVMFHLRGHIGCTRGDLSCDLSMLTPTHVNYRIYQVVVRTPVVPLPECD